MSEKFAELVPGFGARTFTIDQLSDCDRIRSEALQIRGPSFILINGGGSRAVAVVPRELRALQFLGLARKAWSCVRGLADSAPR